jgi:gliding motility-associated-like protein
MKKFTEKEFDNFIRNQLYDYEEEPPAEVFNSLKKQVDKTAFNKTLKYFIGSTSILITGVVLYMLLLNNNNYSTISKNEIDNTFFISNNKTTSEVNSQTTLKDDKLTIGKKERGNTKVNTNNNYSNLEINNIIVNEKSYLKQEQNFVLVDKTKENIKYEIITSASTCKKWNGKAEIKCNLSDVSFYWKELKISMPYVENVKYGKYTVYAKRGDVIIDTLIVNIPDSGSVKADFKIYDLILGNEVVTFTENLSLIDKKLWKENNNVSFSWNFGDGSTSNEPEPKHYYAKSGNYNVTLVVTSSYGCIDSITKSYIIEIPVDFVKLPNVFSPNGDGINDEFSPLLYDMQDVECIIFDRNGNIIYSWKGINGKWDGKIKNTNELASPGTYYYILKGISKSGKKVTHKGMIQLVL